MEKIMDKLNMAWGLTVAVFSTIFGEHWYLFAAFMALNVVDYITGIIKAKLSHTENSNKGLKGIVKKVGYWVVIAISFFIAFYFADMGTLIGIDLGFTTIIGWFTLATFIINEIRSILENLVAIGVDVPGFLTKGLSVAAEKMKEGYSDDENRA